MSENESLIHDGCALDPSGKEPHKDPALKKDDVGSRCPPDSEDYTENYTPPRRTPFHKGEGDG